MKQRKTESSTSTQNQSNGNHKPTAIPEVDRLVSSNFGAVVFLTVLPFVLQYAWFSCSKFECSDIETIKYLASNPLSQVMSEVFPTPSYTAVAIYAAWVSGQWLLHILVPGPIVLGHPITWDGSRLPYKVNGLTTTLLTVAAFIIAVYTGHFDPSVIVGYFGELLFTANIWAYSLSLFLYLKGALFKQGNPSGKVLLDFFYGYEPNPRIFNTITSDFKWFSEGRALTGWMMMDFCLAFHQYKTAGSISYTMGLVTLLHSWYVIHYFIVEVNVLAMMDFTADHMGWMLGWGNFVWVNFSFPMQAWVALKNPHNGNPIVLAGVFAFYCLGYAIFSQANIQKMQFRNDPTKPIWGKKPEVLKTAGGRNLLVSGWWGIARKINYTGDLIIAYSFALACTHIAVAAFLYPGYLTVLLLHRAHRDNEWCKLKYGKDWDAYCKKVPYQFIPYVY